MLSTRCWHLTLKARALPGPDANHAYTPPADVASQRSFLNLLKFFSIIFTDPNRSYFSISWLFSPDHSDHQITISPNHYITISPSPRGLQFIEQSFWATSIFPYNFFIFECLFTIEKWKHINPDEEKQAYWLRFLFLFFWFSIRRIWRRNPVRRFTSTVRTFSTTPCCFFLYMSTMLNLLN